MFLLANTVYFTTQSTPKKTTDGSKWNLNNRLYLNYVVSLTELKFSLLEPLRTKLQPNNIMSNYNYC